MKIKQSNLNINKNKNVNVPINTVEECIYINEKNEVDLSLSKDNILYICNNLDKLDMKDHIEIYKLLRSNGIPSEFFSKTTKGLYFDFSKLSLEIQWKIYNVIVMGVDNIARNKIFDKCIEEHNKHSNFPMA